MSTKGVEIHVFLIRYQGNHISETPPEIPYFSGLSEERWWSKAIQAVTTKKELTVTGVTYRFCAAHPHKEMKTQILARQALCAGTMQWFSFLEILLSILEYFYENLSIPKFIVRAGLLPEILYLPHKGSLLGATTDGAWNRATLPGRTSSSFMTA